MHRGARNADERDQTRWAAKRSGSTPASDRERPSDAFSHSLQRVLPSECLAAAAAYGQERALATGVFQVAYPDAHP